MYMSAPRETKDAQIHLPVPDPRVSPAKANFAYISLSSPGRTSSMFVQPSNQQHKLLYTKQAPTKETQRPGIGDRTRASKESPGTSTHKPENTLEMVQCNFVQVYIFMSDRKTKQMIRKKRKRKMHVMKA